MNPLEILRSFEVPVLPPSPPVTDQEFYNFYSIDRELYTRLVGQLGRDPFHSVYYMAFLTWLERQACDSTMMAKMLHCSAQVLNQLTDETVGCLRCLKNDAVFLHEELFQFPDPAHLSPRFLHENRVEIVRRVIKILTTVSARAFEDMVQSALRGEPLPPPRGATGHMQRDQMALERFGSRLCSGFLYEILRIETRKQEQVDDRMVDKAVFLKFRAGCRITEDEIREFFTRICGGDVVEKIAMQEDARSRMVACALLVVHSTAAANAIHGEGLKEYVINGNQVRARRFLEKEQQYNSTVSP
ncbi:hypothetical protein F511_21165 [Dorcoceras hygrometricum]|uniref:Uncharacterized protein n=1 Tax=Dorcoceras hygrometricum TaxID=472368 RepID=A0A2Z7DKT5_9LAMI|nr:hypothetical protein F511_21165 [Dorcoceras hygrometricum]